MRLIHFAKDPLVEVYPVPAQQPGMKPKGLWVSDEDAFGWREWCTDESFGEDRLSVAHEITLAPDADILRIHDAWGIDDLTSRFASGRETGGYALDWSAVADLHQGILITPYIGIRRLSMHCGWYYGWDCASGCIWDSAAIESFRTVELAPLAVES